MARDAIAWEILDHLTKTFCAAVVGNRKSHPINVGKKKRGMMNNHDKPERSENISEAPYSQSFKTTLHVPPGPLDPVDKFSYDTQGTVGISVEILVTFGCDQEPKIDKTKITGLNQVGFIISSEYEVEPYVDGSKKVPCEKKGCQEAIQYEIVVKFFVYLVIGVGFGLGWGTGTAGWRSKSLVQSTNFTTRCICCDEGALP